MSLPSVGLRHIGFSTNTCDPALAAAIATGAWLPDVKTSTTSRSRSTRSSQRVTGRYAPNRRMHASATSAERSSTGASSYRSSSSLRCGRCITCAITPHPTTPTLRRCAIASSLLAQARWAVWRPGVRRASGGARRGRRGPLHLPSAPGTHAAHRNPHQARDQQPEGGYRQGRDNQQRRDGVDRGRDAKLDLRIDVDRQRHLWADDEESDHKFIEGQGESE